MSDQQFYENFSCGAERNYTGYCSAEVDQLIDRQSSEADTGKRNRSYGRSAQAGRGRGPSGALLSNVGACWQPYSKGHTMMVNGNYNGWRLEDAWLDE
jgi:peptide/nickel transport system substrate-binding protein